tara:strand:- start:115 stop:1074 length:960 start_codon:yes stop_codon:yes gene_type:complete
MKILITGVAGFIGFNFAKHLLSKNYIIYGIDNFDNYYSPKFKHLRIKELKKSKKFHFKKIDITKKKILKKYFANKEFDFIFHFAAQAGVRYSIINPRKYIKVNKEGFENIIDNLDNIKSLKKVFYASSSSVYGSRKKFPSRENLKLFPQSIYAKTKLQNEKFAKKISKKISYDLIGLRFFTVYGEWGRPDMFIFKILNAHMNKKNFYLNNFGNHERDFTYIKDIVVLLEKFLKKRKFKHKIFNICSSRPINIRTLCFYLKDKLNIKKIIEVKKNNYDVNKTHGDNKLIKQYFKIKRFTKFQTGLNNTVKWYLKSKIYKL